MSEAGQPAHNARKDTRNANGKAPAKQKRATNGAQHGDDAMGALGELICRLNPYTELPPDPVTKLKTGRMEVATVPPANAAYGQDHTIACMAIEAERNYNATWTFKGQTQKVKAAFRIPYRFQVQDERGQVRYWQTEYLLIGYAGGDGPG